MGSGDKVGWKWGATDGSITVPAEAYNIFTVGNIYDNNTVTRADDSIWSSSSSGPTQGGRKKPDVCAPGTKIYTTLTNGSYGQNLTITGEEITGTSFAAPHVAGAIALLMDFWIPNPLIIKAILVNTASDQIASDDPDDWDKRYGWGYITLMQAYNKRWNYKYKSITQGQHYYFQGQMYPNQTATIVWHSHVDYVDGTGPGTVTPLSDLDLYLWDYTGGQQGTLLDYANGVIDNVEQVEYRGSTYPKDVLIEVHAYSLPAGVTSEDFVLHINSLSSFTEIPSPAPPISSFSDLAAITAELGQNFPNPFNPDTWMPYAISEKASVTIQIFNANGQQVRTLSLGQKAPGRYFSREKAAYWDGHNDAGEQVASGVYFYYIKAGDFQATQKMVISK